jgi:thiamine biosynthesis protein ThiS
MILNGREYEFREGMTLHALLAELGAKPRNVVVMHGQHIHRRGEIPDAAVARDDVIEIISMMQGG